MGLKHYKPITPARRFYSGYDFSEVTKTKPEKSLTVPYKKTGGRNNYGRITLRFRGGGHKRKLRIIDFQRDKIGVNGKVAAIEYDPNRTARIALVNYADGEKRYILAPDSLKVGDKIISSRFADILPGNSLPLKYIPQGTLIHNIELKRGKGGQLVRSAGTAAQIMGKEGSYILIRLPSGELRKIHEECRATIGQVSNIDHSNIVIGKAGRNRWKGKRPHVRGVAMNPVDHPLGGGEGRSHGGRHPVSPWGWITKGRKTRNNKNTDKFIVRRRK